MQFTASFLSEKPGDFKANLFLSYESGIMKLCALSDIKFRERKREREGRKKKRKRDGRGGEERGMY